jgi:hypothetical protein
VVDDLDAVGWAQTIGITVNGPNVLPSVSLTSPSRGATFAAPATLALRATASDSDGSIASVEFLKDGQPVGASNSAPYALDLAGVPVGSHSFSARATDDRGGVGSSAPVTVNVVQPPQVGLSASLSGALVATGSTLTFNAHASSGNGGVSRVEFLRGLTLVGVDTTAPYSFTWSDVPPGDHVLMAKVVDGLGLSAFSAVPFTVTAGPTASLSAPAANATFPAPATIALAANAQAGPSPLARVEFYQGSTLIGTATTAPYIATWANAPAGTHQLSVRAVDGNGVVAYSSAVSVNVVAPSIVIDSPAAGAAVPPTGVLVRGRITAPSGSGVNVNGRVALVDEAGNFAVGSVSVPQAGGAITARLTTPDDAVATATVAVTTGPALSSTVEIVKGAESVGTLQPQLRISSPNGIARVDVDAFGSGTVNLSSPGNGAPQMQLTLNYGASVGLFLPVVTVVDQLGNTLSHRLAVKANSIAQMNQMFMDLWGGMVGKVRSGDAAGAVRAVSPASRPRFQAIFENLRPDPATAMDALGSLQGNLLGVDAAEYLLVRLKSGVQAAYPVNFIRSADGVWRVSAM